MVATQALRCTHARTRTYTRNTHLHTHTHTHHVAPDVVPYYHAVAATHTHTHLHAHAHAHTRNTHLHTHGVCTQHVAPDVVPYYHAKAATQALRSKLWPYMTEGALNPKLLANHITKWQVGGGRRGARVYACVEMYLSGGGACTSAAHFVGQGHGPRPVMSPPLLNGPHVGITLSFPYLTVPLPQVYDPATESYITWDEAMALVRAAEQARAAGQQQGPAGAAAAPGASGGQ